MGDSWMLQIVDGEMTQRFGALTALAEDWGGSQFLHRGSQPS